jgi:AbiEi antitoxin C-terminal domain
MPPLSLDRPFTYDQWLAAGNTRGHLRRLLSSESVRRVARGVYAPSTVPDSLSLRLEIAALVLPPRGVLARTGASWVYGVDTRPPGPSQPLRLEAAVPVGVEPVSSGVVRCFVEDLDDEDVQVVGGIPVTTPLRTAVDLARWLPRGDALAAVDALAHQELIDLRDYEHALERWQGYPFVRQAREVGLLADARSESWGESMTRLRLHDAGFEMPEPQVLVYPGGAEYRLDFGWCKLRKALEYDGERWHTSEAQRRHDDLRRERIASAGWEWRVVTKEHVLGRGRHFEELICELTGLVPQRPIAPAREVELRHNSLISEGAAARLATLP